MYKNIQNVHSPLSPLCPNEFKRNTSQAFNYFTPSRPNTINSFNSRRRTFTPTCNEITPPIESPITPLIRPNNDCTLNSTITKDDSLLDSSSSGSSSGGAGTNRKLNNSLNVFSDGSSNGVFKTPTTKMPTSLPNSAIIPRRAMGSVHFQFKRLVVEKTPSRAKPMIGAIITPRSKTHKPIVLHKTSLSYDSSASEASPDPVNQTLQLEHTPMNLHLSPMPPTEDGHNNSILEKTFNVQSILQEIGMEKYVDLFEREEIDIIVLFTLTAKDLTTLGIDEEDRDTLLRAIKSFAKILNIDYPLEHLDDARFR